MNNMVKAVLIICATALIMFVLYFKFFSPLAQCEKRMMNFQGWSKDKSTVACIGMMNGQ
jgi:hypothetical protein